MIFLFPMLLFLNHSLMLILLFFFSVIKFTKDWVVVMSFRIFLVDLVCLFVYLFLNFLFMILFEVVIENVEVPRMMLEQFF